MAYQSMLDELEDPGKASSEKSVLSSNAEKLLLESSNFIH